MSADDRLFRLTVCVCVSVIVCLHEDIHWQIECHRQYTPFNFPTNHKEFSQLTFIQIELAKEFAPFTMFFAIDPS